MSSGTSSKGGPDPAPWLRLRLDIGGRGPGRCLAHAWEELRASLRAALSKGLASRCTKPELLYLLGEGWGPRGRATVGSTE